VDRTLLRQLFDTAVAAAQPVRTLPLHLPPRPAGRTVVVGAGKASAQMAQALELCWDGPLTGLVVTRYGHGAACRAIEVVEASHPLPDAAGLLAARRMLETVSGLGPDDLVIALISGGGSALLPAPAPGLTLEDEQAVNRTLLASGMQIGAMNLIRNQFSAIKGGRLARHCAPARVATLVMSDVPGDDPALVASGPTLPMAGTRADARRLVATYRLDLPPAVVELLGGEDNLAPHPDDPLFRRNSVAIIASARLSLDAAAAQARHLGLEVAVLSDAMEGEAREAGRMHAALAREIGLRDRPFRKPVVLLSGGETSVRLDGPAGQGGRNAEFLLGFALGIEGLGGITAFAADTDGIDGTGPAAGAWADSGSVGRMRDAGVDPLRALLDHDATGALAAIGDTLVTGPTGTNVNDFRAILVR
jgi:glycerate 2-kinase